MNSGRSNKRSRRKTIRRNKRLYATHGPEEIKFRGEENQKSEILTKDIK